MNQNVSRTAKSGCLSVQTPSPTWMHARSMTSRSILISSSVCSQGSSRTHNNVDFIFELTNLRRLNDRWNILQPSFQFVEGSLLPLMGVLDKNTHVLKANFSYAGMKDPRFRFSGNGNSNARVLRYILTKNKCIQELNLSNTGLDDDGVNEICEGIKKNNTLHSLNLSSNHFGEIGAEKLRLALEQNNSIKQIDLSQNALGFRSINSIVCSCGPKHIVIQTHGNFVFEEILNSVSHGIAFLASVVGANLLLTSAAESKNYTDYHFWACILYSCALMFLFLSSCLFHSFFMMPSSKLVI